MQVKVTFLNHSGFLLEWETCYWLFDYYKGTIPELDQGKKLFVFCSHSHGDHFNPRIFELFGERPMTQFVFSSELKSACRREEKRYKGNAFPEIIFLNAWADMELIDGKSGLISVHAMHSTDQGAAFYLEYQGKAIYHAGDLHWWVWPGEPEDENRQMTGNYKKEMQYLEGKQIDLAFTPLDPRQEEAYDLGMDYLLSHAQVKYAFPMHCWGDFAVITRYLAREKKVPEGTDVIKIEQNGQNWEVEL